MKAKQANLLKFLQTSKQFIIPIYQRTYSWQESQCQQLLHDIIGISKAEDNAGHFVGSVVYFEQDHHNASEVPELLIIDGQQRVTTLTLLLAALAELVQQHPDVLESTSATKLKNYYLFNAEEEGVLRYKLMLTRGDKQSLIDVLEKHPKPPVEVASNVRRNYEYFRKHLTLDNARTIYAGLQRLFIVDVALERGVDNPQMIFKSMNSTGLALSQADLIRNYVLMGQEPKTQARLYEHYWFPMEQLFGEHYASLFDWFVRDYLTLKTGHIPRIDGVYASYKTFLKNTESAIGGRGAAARPAPLRRVLRAYRPTRIQSRGVCAPAESAPGFAGTAGRYGYPVSAGSICGLRRRVSDGRGARAGGSPGGSLRFQARRVWHPHQ